MARRWHHNLEFRGIGEVMVLVPPSQDLKTRMGTLRQPSVDDGNDPPAIVSSEQAPTIDDGI